LALQKILAFRRWDWGLEAGRDTVGAMRNGTTSVAVVLAVDWLAGELSAEEHEAVVAYIANEAGPAAERAVFGMTHHAEVVGWSMAPDAGGFEQSYRDIDFSRWPAILDVNNLRIIATSGLAAAAAFLHGRHPRAADWATMADASMRLFVSRLPADGSFPEGPDYWSFTYTYYCVAAELLRRRCGHDLRDSADFPAMARYVQLVHLPTRSNPAGCINIGDAFMTAGAEALAWIGRHFRDGTANHLVLRPGTIRNLTNSAWAAIWFDPDVPARRAADLTTDRVLFPGIVVSHSGWEADDAVVALRSGEPENHEHADRNSLLFVAHGERLFWDPLKASYSPTHPKWRLRLTEAHSAVLIDGRGHQYHNGEEGTNASRAHATLVDHRIGPGWMLAVSDAADAYAEAGLPVHRLQRTVLFLKPDVLIVCDEVDLTQPMPVQTRWQVQNDDKQGAVVTDADGFTVTRPHATLRARVIGGAELSVSSDTLPLPPEEGVYPYAAVTSPAGLQHRLLTICSAAPAGEEQPLWSIEGAAHGWQITGTHRGRDLDLRITCHDEGAPTLIF
ncbi:MAG: heparinase II/III domain-containing protein, partial [Cephaloticoccus sp.]